MFGGIYVESPSFNVLVPTPCDQPVDKFLEFVFVGPMGMEKFCGVNAVGYKETTPSQMTWRRVK